MKRIIEFKKTETGYACYEDDENIFEISKTDLQFNVKLFYQAFYADGREYDNIELLKCEMDDKTGERVYECIKTIMDRVKSKIDSQKQSINNS